jgi:hypothetical protein
VESLRAALKAAEEKDWKKLEMVLVDAQIDYTTLMRALNKGYRHVPVRFQYNCLNVTLCFPNL